ncbi:neuferricin [Corythoichthys intestinalis]|uniref:neuferricin n=1 Tax=Corythoichthys intestinalis TaxID=161448 RepID=UPI0025A4D7B6|nr:neuferricin [Corythoichthys intestinalis]
MLCYVILSILSACLAALFLPGQWWLKSGSKSRQELPRPLLNSHELSLYDGKEGSKGIYLAILGQVFDVREGRKHYGPGGAYHFLAGKDASLAFITGDFTESGLTDDVSSLSPLQVVALFDWLLFYQRTYQSVGLVIGRFYSKSGKPTAFLLHVESLLVKGQQLKAKTEAEMLYYPSCNSQWSTARGGRVWCSTQSGGIQRSWTGVPRKLFSVGASGSRCVCVEDPSTANENPNLQEYDGCPTHEAILQSEP